MILGATIRLKDEFSTTMAKARQATGEMTRSMKLAGVQAGIMKRDFQEAYDAAKPKNSFEGAKQLGTGMAAAGTAMAAGIGLAAKTAMDFDAQMSRVKAISGASAGEFKKLEAQAIKLGAATSYSATESAEGMENLASAGFSTKEIMAAMPGMLDLAASSGEDLATSADIAASTLRGFGLAANQAGHVADVLAKNAAKTNAAVADTGEAMKYVAPVAHAAGLSFEQVAAAIGILANNGIKGSEAGTTLRGALTRLASPSKEAADMMKAMGFSAFDAHGRMLPLDKTVANLRRSMKGMTDQQKQNAIATIFGQEAMAGILTLIQAGPDQLNNLTSSLTHSKGAARAMAEEIQNNLKGTLGQLHGETETLAINLGKRLTPSIRAVLKAITNLFSKFNGLSPRMQKIIAVSAAVSTAFLLITGPMLILIGLLPNIAAGLSMVRKALEISTKAFNPYTLAILAVIAVGVLLYKNWDKIKDAANSFKNKILNLKTAALDKLKDTINSLKKSFNDYKDTIKKVATVLTTIFGPALVDTGIQAVISGAQITGSFIASVISTGTQAVIAATKVTVSFIASMANAGLQATISGIQITISFIGSLIKTSAQAAATAAVITGRLIGSMLLYAATGWVIFATTMRNIGAWLIQKGVIIASTIVTWAQVAAQWALNAAMYASPYGWVIAAVMAVIAVIVLCYKHWNQIKAKVIEVWGAAKAAVSSFVSSATAKFISFKTKVISIWNSIKAFLKNPIRGTINLVTNRTGKKVGKNAAGTNYWHGGLTWVGEQGPELVDLARGARVYNNSDSRRIASSSTVTVTGNTFVVREDADIDRIARAIAAKLEGANMNFGGAA